MANMDNDLYELYKQTMLAKNMLKFMGKLNIQKTYLWKTILLNL